MRPAFGPRTILAGVLFLLAWGPVAGWAHVFPAAAEPRVGVTVSAPPTVARISFDGALEPVFSTLRVQDAAGRQVDRGDCRVDPSDPTVLLVGLPPLTPGTYRVLWSVVGRDGHRTEGDYTFTVE